jgi:hypothetical protein
VSARPVFGRYGDTLRYSFDGASSHLPSKNSQRETNGDVAFI